METPSSTRRVTRSQTKASLNNTKATDLSNSGPGESGTRQRKNGRQRQVQAVLVDITNDSPIVGLAMGTVKTPSSSLVKQKSARAKKTHGSGEALLRGQVKTLLQKVEEEAEFSKFSLESRSFLHLKGFASSPIGLLAPTPTNTPSVPNLSDDGLPSAVASPVVEEHLIRQMVGDFVEEQNYDGLESQKSLITRSLFSDFSEKSEISDVSECSSDVTYQGGVGENEDEKKASQDVEDDNSSVWSMQVNVSTNDEDEEEEEEDEEDDVEEGSIDELCSGISKMSMNEKKGTDKFEGKHIRFVYNSDDEVVEEKEELPTPKGSVSPSVMHLKGLPTPKGKHLRFPLEQENNY